MPAAAGTCPCAWLPAALWPAAPWFLEQHRPPPLTLQLSTGHIAAVVVLLSRSSADAVPSCLQVEACDVFEGFLMLQSMAGGTGAGAGTYMAQALVDAYSSAHVLNCCVW